MGATLSRINASYRARGLPTVAMRIGVNTGTMVAGSLGSADRLKYTVVGDAVVVAQRLEALEDVEHDFDTSPCRVLVSEETARQLGDAFRLEPLGPRALKGKDEPVSCSGCSARKRTLLRASERSLARRNAAPQNATTFISTEMPEFCKPPPFWSSTWRSLPPQYTAKLARSASW